MITEALLCLSLNIYHEARGEPLAGQLAVGLVTMNRVESPRFPNTVCDVVHQGHYDSRGNPVRNKCHFSWWCDGKPDMPINEKSWSESIAVAYKVKEYMVSDFTDKATHYHATHVDPWWKVEYTYVVQIGNHLFYR